MTPAAEMIERPIVGKTFASGRNIERQFGDAHATSGIGFELHVRQAMKEPEFDIAASQDAEQR
jgi:hypothetical protein